MRDFNKIKRIVIKIGTNTLTKDSTIDSSYIRSIARQVNDLRDLNKQVVIISSGAIGMGAMQLKLATNAKTINMRQACAAIGQPLLMAEYKKAFQKYGIKVGQVLLTAEVLDHRRTYLNLRNAIEQLLLLGALPIINENDSVSTDEIGTAFGDNDRLSALVASKLDADLLIMLTDIDALYDKNPRTHPDARPISTVFEITEDMMCFAGQRGSRHAIGGMKTKLQAALIASNADCRIVIAHGRTRNVITRILAGESLGTIFLPKQRLSNRARWILNSKPAGIIRIDEGAMKAIRQRKSLLPSGVIKVDGTFNAGDVVQINETVKALSSLSSAQLQQFIGKHTREIKKQLGPDHRDVVAIPEDIVIID